MEHPLRVLFIDDSFESYSFLIGYVLQKKKVDYIVKKASGYSFMRPPMCQLNRWLIGKGYPAVISSLDTKGVLAGFIRPDLINLVKAKKIVENIKAPLLVFRDDKVKLYDYQSEWCWDDKVLKAMVNLSDTPQKVKNYIENLYKESRTRTLLSSAL